MQQVKAGAVVLLPDLSCHVPSALDSLSDPDKSPGL